MNAKERAAREAEHRKTTIFRETMAVEQVRYPVINAVDKAFEMLTTAHEVYMACSCFACRSDTNQETKCPAWQVQRYVETLHDQLKCEADGKRLDAIRADREPKDIFLDRALKALAAMAPICRACKCAACSNQNYSVCPLIIAEAIIENHVALLRAEKTPDRLRHAQPGTDTPPPAINCQDEFRRQIRQLVPGITHLLKSDFAGSHLNDALVSLKNEHQNSGALETIADWTLATKVSE